MPNAFQTDLEMNFVTPTSESPAAAAEETATIATPKDGCSPISSGEQPDVATTPEPTGHASSSAPVDPTDSSLSVQLAQPSAQPSAQPLAHPLAAESSATSQSSALIGSSPEPQAGGSSLPSSPAPIFNASTPVVVKVMNQLPPKYEHLAYLDPPSLMQLLAPVQRLVMEKLLNGCNPAEAAEQTGTPRATAYRWKHEPLFSTVFKLLQAHTLADTRNVIKQLSIRATAVLADELNRGNYKVAMDIVKQSRMFEEED